MLQKKFYFSFLLFIATSVLTFSSCKKKDVRSNLAGLTSFSVKEFPVSFTIDEVQQKISNADSLPFGTDVSKLTAVFTAVPKSKVMVSSVEQQSGVTVNSFTSPVTYTVVAEDGTTNRSYLVSVNVAKVDPKTISWQQITADAGWGNFHTDVATSLGGKFYQLGSTLGSFGAFNFTSNVSSDGAVWTRTRAVDNNGDSVPHVESPAFLSFNNKLWILGGHRPGVGFAFDDVTNNTWNSSDGLSWTASGETADAAARWSKRERAGALVFNNKLWVIGGNGYPAFGNTNMPSAAYNDVWNSSDGTTWTQVSSGAQFTARTEPSVFSYDNKIWVVGGKDNGGTYLNEVWNSADGVTWNQVTVNTPFPARNAAQIVVNNDEIILVGGESTTGVLADMWVSNNKGVDWTQVQAGNVMALPPSFKARKDFSMFIKDGAIYIVGGLGVKDPNTAVYAIINDVWKGKLQ